MPLWQCDVMRSSSHSLRPQTAKIDKSGDEKVPLHKHFLSHAFFSMFILLFRKRRIRSSFPSPGPRQRSYVIKHAHQAPPSDYNTITRLTGGPEVHTRHGQLDRSFLRQRTAVVSMNTSTMTPQFGNSHVCDFAAGASERERMGYNSFSPTDPTDPANPTYPSNPTNPTRCWSKRAYRSFLRRTRSLRRI
jgi:hypothetical protein